MKYLVISDVHANYPALEAVMNDLDTTDYGIIFVGDMIGLMGYPRMTVDFLKENGEHVIKGNHDFAVIDNKMGHVNSKELSEFELNTTWDALTTEHVEWIKSLDSYKEVDDEGILIAHAQPEPEFSTGYKPGNAGIRKRDYVRTASKIDTDKYDFLLLGHTHQQAHVNCSKFGQDIHVVNPGSVGQPIDSKAEYAIIDTDENTVELRKTSFDEKRIKEKLEDLGVPIKWWEQKPKKTYTTRYIEK